MNELDAEYQRLALEARDWIEAVTKKKFAPGDFIEALSDGVMLCRLMRVLLPGSVKSINKSKMPFAKRENITSYIKAARAFGQIPFEMFSTEDLASKKNLKSVISSLHSLGRKTQQTRPDIKPRLGIAVTKGLERVEPVKEKWVQKKDPNGRTFWVCSELGLSAWKKPSSEDVALANLEHWVEMCNPDGRRYCENVKTGEVRWTDEGSSAATADVPATAAVQPPPIPGGAGAGAGAGATGTPEDTSGDGGASGATNGGDKAGGDDELHDEWEEVATEDGTPYYRHKTTYETRWDKPTNAVVAAEAAGGDGASGELDPDWEEVPMDDGSGTVYYRHKTTYETRWDRPIAGAADAPLPDGWVKVTAEDGSVYYENTETGETAWEPPAAAA